MVIHDDRQLLAGLGGCRKKFVHRDLQRVMRRNLTDADLEQRQPLNRRTRLFTQRRDFAALEVDDK
jgi:hypothetical protein